MAEGRNRRVRIGTTPARPSYTGMLPAVPKNLPGELGQYLMRLVSVLENKLGQRGDPRDRAVTVRELEQLGFVTRRDTAQYNPAKPADDLINRFDQRIKQLELRIKQLESQP